MQLLIIALALGIFIHDAFLADASPVLTAPALLAAFALPKIALAAVYALGCRFVLARLGRPGGGNFVRRLDQSSLLLRILLLTLYGLDLYLGVLRAVRSQTGDLILVDELLVMLPTLALILWSWWAYYPVDRRLREASLISQIDSGRPVYPIWTRAQFLLAQSRHQIMLILVPLLLIMGWAEFVQQLAPSPWPGVGDPRPILVGAGALTVFLLAPVILRHLWDTVPLPPGEIRDSLVTLCVRHNISVRELLLWRTFGGMINAAVMGLIAPVRYILLTDALLDMLHRDEVEAVMAHELGHVRRRHMFWLLAAAVGTLGLLELLAYAILLNVEHTAHQAPPVLVAGWDLDPRSSPAAIVALVAGAAAIAWIIVFGWISRRFERQADTFAVQSLATHRAQTAQPDEPGTPIRIDPHSANTMISALGHVARLSHIPLNRRSWRHGSIASRQAYLRSLVGQPVDRLSIDRQMRWINLAAAAAVAIVIVANFLN